MPQGLADAWQSVESFPEMLAEAGWNVERANHSGEVLRISNPGFGTANVLIAGTD